MHGDVNIGHGAYDYILKNYFYEYSNSHESHISRPSLSQERIETNEDGQTHTCIHTKFVIVRACVWWLGKGGEA